MSRQEWMARYGSVLQSEEWFEGKAPAWNYDQHSWWFQSVGRQPGTEPLWMRRQWHMPELDCPGGRDPREQTLDERRAAGEVPLWAERLNHEGATQGKQSATIYGHRQEYKPSQKTEARSMVSVKARPKCADHARHARQAWCHHPGHASAQAAPPALLCLPALPPSLPARPPACLSESC